MNNQRLDAANVAASGNVITDFRNGIIEERIRHVEFDDSDGHVWRKKEKVEHDRTSSTEHGEVSNRAEQRGAEPSVGCEPLADRHRGGEARAMRCEDDLSRGKGRAS